MQPQNEIDKFFNDLPKKDVTDANVFNDKAPAGQAAPAPVKDADDEGDVRKNRRHRRIEAELQRERESNIAMAERIKVLSEMDKFAKDTDGLVNPDIAKMFADTPEGKENALRLSQTLRSMKDEAKSEALKEIESRQAQTVREQREYETLIDNELESLEDEHNIDLTSDAPQARKARREFLELVQHLSPKDEDGNVTGYADFGATFEQYQKTSAQVQNIETSNRQKELASRSMQRSGTNNGQSAAPATTPGFRGWQKDYGLN